MSVNIYQNPQFSDTPLGLKLRQTLTSSGSVTIPAGVGRVYAVCVGGGGGGGCMVGGQYTTITAASADGTTVTYTGNNTLVAQQRVTITGLTTIAFNLSNVIVATASATGFTVTNAATGTAVIFNLTRQPLITKLLTLKDPTY